MNASHGGRPWHDRSGPRQRPRPGEPVWERVRAYFFFRAAHIAYGHWGSDVIPPYTAGYRSLWVSYVSPASRHKGATEWSARTLAGGEQSSAVAVAVAVAVEALHLAGVPA